MDCDGTELFDLAREYVNGTGVSVFLTGKAGTGKTTFLHNIVKQTNKRFVVVAPTGVAAVNAGGVTIHSFFSLPLCPYLPDVKELVTEYQLPLHKRWLRGAKADIVKTLDLLIIDEISMVRADLLDAVDDILRRTRRSSKPFGGVQLLMIGDLQQLPPVVTDSEKPYMDRVYPSPFFFHSKALGQVDYVTIELKKVFRQSDSSFIDVLNDLRDCKFSLRTRKALESRYIPGFEPPDDERGFIRLTTHNRQADAVNQHKLEALEGKMYEFRAVIDGNFPETSAPVDILLRLKEGAQVMFARNDRDGRYYNGKIAIVRKIGDEGITVEDTEGNLINVAQESWENIRYEISSEDNSIVQVNDGTFTQYPLRPAWAITIHKSQGLTFDKVVIDASRAFSFGQVYVALSRCRTLEGVVLTSPITSSCLYRDSDVSEFNSSRPDQSVVSDALEGYLKAYYMDKLCEAFDLQPLRRAFNPLYRIYHLNLASVYPAQEAQFSSLVTEQIRPLSEVSDKFIRQMTSLADNQEFLRERVAKAAAYFCPKLSDIAARVAPLLYVEIDNKERKKEFNDAAKVLLAALGLALTVQKSILEEGFSVDKYHHIKVDCALNKTASHWRNEFRTANKPASQKTVSVDDDTDVYADNRHPEAVKALVEWRRSASAAAGLPAYFVLSQKTLLQIADTMPFTKDEFMDIKGFGKNKYEKYAKDILEILEPFRQ